ncbi:MAG: TIGR02757 family protein [Candidatus Gastranaerophilaceae bacterium]|jgi:uncharacterized protein (TIGR02757 family)
MKDLKNYLDELVIKYETEDFIKKDPVQFPHRFRTQTDIEVSALISSCLAYGKREAFIEKLEFIHKIMGNSPADFCLNFDLLRDIHFFENFCYRFTSGTDISLLINSLSLSLKEFTTIENMFMQNYKISDICIKNALIHFVERFYEYNVNNSYNKKGLCYLLPNPKSGSACKRLNLFLKWMVRKAPVDLNIWKNVDPSKLLIPLDVHVARISRKLEFTSRKSNDWLTAQEITEKLRKFDAKDPVKYDFALFDIGIDKLLN